MIDFPMHEILLLRVAIVATPVDSHNGDRIARCDYPGRSRTRHHRTAAALTVQTKYPTLTRFAQKPASPASKSPLLADIEGKRVKITGRIEMCQGKTEMRINAASQLS